LKRFENLALVQRLDVIKTLCKDRSVLHLGCTNYPYTEEAISNNMLLHFDLREISSELYGFDSDKKGLDILSDYGFTNLFEADLELLNNVPVERTFDVIVAGEIIEHLNNPGLFLSGVRRFMHRDSKLVITTINAYCAMRFFVYALRGRRGINEFVHPDHVAYYSYSTLRVLLSRYNYDIETFLFYDIGREHRPHNMRILNLVNDFAVFFSSHLSDGLIAICRLPDDGLRLADANGE
jgi:SAM-dependent methyltransferase